MKIILVIALAVCCMSAQAQLRKCTGADGKVTYSDVVCSNTSVEGGVKNRVSNMDMPGLKREVDNSRQEKTNASINEMMANPPLECKFKSYVNNDEKGKLLADKAKRECIQNILAAKEGRPTSKEDYAMWKDHHDQTSAKREASVSRAISTINAANKPMQITPITQDVRCRPNAMGSALICN